MRPYTFLALAILAGSLCAQTDADKKIRVEGRVTAVNGEAVPRAAVRLQGVLPPATNFAAPPKRPANYTASSGDDGKFAFDNVAPGNYNLTSEKAGFVTQRYGARSFTGDGALIVVAVGMEAKEFSLRMTPQAVLSGKITDQDGDPVAGVQVAAYRNGYANGRRQLVSSATGQTDDEGNYRISNIAPGRYYVAANPRTNGQERPGRAAPQSVNVPTFHPNSPDFATGPALDLEAGGEMRGIDIQLRRERVYSVRGKVTDIATGMPLGNARVADTVPDSPSAVAVLGTFVAAGPDGKFEIRGVRSGTRTLVGSAGSTITISSAGGTRIMTMQLAERQAGEDSATGQAKVTIGDSDVNDVVLPLSGGGVVTGSIIIEDGDLKEWYQRRTIRLVTDENISASAPTAPLQPDGTFALKGVAPMRYFVQTGALPAGVYLKSMRFGGKDATNSMLDLRSGGGSLQIVLSAKGADFSGTVRNENGEPVQGVPVSLWPKIRDRSNVLGSVKVANTDQNGGFKITGLAPGEYFVAAWEDVPEAGITQNADFLERFAGDELAVRFQEGDRVSADVKLIPKDRIIAKAAKIP